MKIFGGILIILGIIGIVVSSLHAIKKNSRLSSPKTDLSSYSEVALPQELESVVSEARTLGKSLAAKASKYGKLALLATFIVLATTSLATILGGLYAVMREVRDRANRDKNSAKVAISLSVLASIATAAEISSHSLDQISEQQRSKSQAVSRAAINSIQSYEYRPANLRSHVLRLEEALNSNR